MAPQYASGKENLKAIVYILNDGLTVFTSIIGSESFALFCLFAFMRKWKYAGTCLAICTVCVTINQCRDWISPYLRAFTLVNNETQAVMVAIILYAFLLLIFLMMFSPLVLPLIIGKIRKKKMKPILGLSFMSCLIPVLFPFAMWLAVKDDNEEVEEKENPISQDLS